MTALVEFTNVARFFELAKNSFVAVRDITLSVSRGEIVTLVGPSGCGKSTLLNMTAGLLAPSAGQVTYAGERVTK